ncbi:MAG TPA: hypothetical protein H9722_04100 [Candidatus Mediterraneibacter pullistercoris]|nr:hypothetical protein [Candidatus Mediterraneibacter pullistercoris]
MSKYCTQCGRKLEDGEVCTCTSQNADAASNVNVSSTQTAGPQQTADTPQNEQQYNQQYSQQYQQAQQSGQQYQQTQQSSQQYQQNSQQYQQAQQNSQQYNQQYQQTQQNRQQYNQQYQQDGQPGGYTKEAEWINRQKNAIVSGTKSMFSEIGPILKAPVSRVRQISSSGSANVGIQLIAAKTVVFLIVVIIALLMLSNQVHSMSYGLIEANMPYFQLILVTLILTLGIDFLEALILKVITGAFNGITNTNTMINVIGARAIYDTFLLLIFVILGMLSWQIAFVVLALLLPISVYIQFASYQGCVRMAEDKKPYAYFVAKLCMSIISFLIVYIIVNTSLESMMNSMLNSIF